MKLKIKGVVREQLISHCCASNWQGSSDWFKRNPFLMHATSEQKNDVPSLTLFSISLAFSCCASFSIFSISSILWASTPQPLQWHGKRSCHPTATSLWDEENQAARSAGECWRPRRFTFLGCRQSCRWRRWSPCCPSSPGSECRIADCH